MSEIKSQMIPDVDMSGCAASEPFALQVIDDSMEPEFKKGCVLVVDPAGRVKHGVYVIARVENGYIFRQLLLEDGCYYLQPVNEDYKHEKREITLDAIEGVIIQQAASTGRRKDRKKYTYE